MTKRLVGDTIMMTRGDTVRIKLLLTFDDGTEYTPQEGDEIRFAAKKNYNDIVPVMYISIPSDTLILTIRPEDTKILDFGKYVYDIQIKFANGDVDTFISRAKLFIEEEVD